MNIFQITPASVARVPILISSPHSGMAFPGELRPLFKPEKLADADDCDFFIPQLYDFAPAMGIPIVEANYHRWVIDLNRDLQQQPLYADGRVITGLVPTTDFNGNALYQSAPPTAEEIARRIETWYLPYHQQLATMLEDIQAEFGYAILWDAHSIRHIVPGIQPQPFPNLILGDNDGAAAAPAFIQTAVNTLSASEYSFSHNHPFKGGHITRFFGKPVQQMHALQMEMTKTCYMDDAQTAYDGDRANNIRSLLQQTFTNLINTLP